MKIKVNGEETELPGEAMTVRELLEALEVARTHGVAVAVNSAVVTRSHWDETSVEEGDEVEVIRAAQGG